MTMPKTSRSNELLTAALGYADEGYAVFPIYELTSAGKCSCGNPDCDEKRWAKHPRNEHGLTDATLDEDEIRQWWTKWPLANIGIRTGDGLTVIDVDERGALAALQNDNEPLPMTRTCKTGRGCHLYMSTPAELDVPNSVGKIYSGIDVRGDGGYVIVPPSIHYSGRLYKWEDRDAPIAPMPDWLIRLCLQEKKKARKIKSAGPMPDKVLKHARNNFLTSVAGTMRNGHFSEAEMFASLIIINQSRCSPPLSEAEVKRVVKSSMNFTPKDAQTVTAVAASAQPAPDQPDWVSKLVLTDRGLPAKCPTNAAHYLIHHDAWRGVLQYDEFAERIIWGNVPPVPTDAGAIAAGEDFADWHISPIRHWLLRQTGMKLGVDEMKHAVAWAAHANPVHPLRTWLNGLKWDGHVRLDKWLSRYLGAVDDDYSRAVGRWWMVSAVARVLSPGCQADHILVLEGPQGVGKSTAVETLFSKRYYLGTLPDIRTKDAVISLLDHWVVEIAELDAIKGANATRIKDFLSQRVDDFRPPYGAANLRRPRQCVFVGTTNPDEYLNDPTGNRRFWPVRVTTIARDELATDREQLWAEAVTRYTGGETWWPDAAAQPMLQEAQEERFSEDAWEPRVEEWAKAHFEFTLGDVLQSCLGLELGKWDRPSQTRVGKVLSRLGYVTRRIRTASDKRLRVYVQK
ncbi:MAG: bifunctional DNA primase/polymerase [Candidatus Omnitrophica bacterium]|nr:bifunctional DNA primase/polymerase [Candidatus Omnitrophota bacterium]